MSNINFNYTKAPEDRTNFTKYYTPPSRSDWTNELLTSLMFRGIFNVSQILNISTACNTSIPFIETDIRVSIPILPTDSSEKLSFMEILSDLVLFEILTGDADRAVILREDERSTTGDTIKSHNVNIFSNGTYSIFDLYNFFPRIKESRVIAEIIDSIRNLFENEFFDDWEYILNGENNFFSRMEKKTNELLGLYEGQKGKDFFLRQVAKSENPYHPPRDIYKKEDVWFDKDLEQYNNTIYTLRNIKSVLGNENIQESFINFTKSNEDFLCKELKNHFLKSIETLQSLIKAKIRKVF